MNLIIQDTSSECCIEGCSHDELDNTRHESLFKCCIEGCSHDELDNTRHESECCIEGS